MQSQKFNEIAKTTWLLIESCKRNLDRLDEQIAECNASREGRLPPASELESKIEPIRVQLCRESARGTRAFSEEANDPEVKRLLRELADSYDRMADGALREARI